MDAVIAVDGDRAFCVKVRDLQLEHRVIVGHDGIRLKPHPTRTRQEGRFEFMSGGVSSERRLATQVGDCSLRTPRTRRAVNRAQRSGASISMETPASVADGAGKAISSRNGMPKLPVMETGPPR